MFKPALTIREKLILLLVFLMLLTGFILFNRDVALFESYIREDGLVEWITVIGLLLGSFVCVSRFFRLRTKKNWWFLTVTIGLALMLFFAAGEEISWGQRILGIQSSEFFSKNNAQGETNLHNLVVNGVKINKLVFSIGLVAAMGIYLLVFPVLYHSKESFRRFADNSGIVIPRAYQVVAIGTVFLLTELIRHGKRAELLEAGIALLFYLVIAFPRNSSIFKNSYR